MIVKTDIYFIGWDYASPDSAALKKMLMSEYSPWNAAGIVHDEVWVDSVDEIPLVTTRHFLEHVAAGTGVLIFIKDPFHKLLWQRHCQEHGLIILDEGLLFKKFALQLAAHSKACDLGVMELPLAFDDTVHELLHAYKDTWKDAASNQAFRAYLHFLETGILADLQKTCSPFSEHPFFQQEHLRFMHLPDRQQATLAWEVSSRRNAFIEQTILQAGMKNLQVAFSSDQANVVKKEIRNLKILLASLGITPQASVITAAGLQEKVADLSVPDLSASQVLANIDVDNPLQILSLLDGSTSAFAARVRVGRRPGQLLDILKKYPMAHLSLRCERPGPSGLHVIINPT